MATRPTFPGVFVREISTAPQAVVAAPTAVAAFVGHSAAGPVQQPVEVRSWSDFVSVFGAPAARATLGPAVQQFFQNGGTQAWIVRLSPRTRAATTWVPKSKSAQTQRKGIYALDALAQFNLLCLPPPAHDSDFPLDLWARAAGYCLQRGAVLLVDAPLAWLADPAIAVAGMEALRQAMIPTARANVAVYGPRLLAPVGADAKRTRAIAPCGAVAGMMARIDASRGVWKAPAGLNATLPGAVGLSHTLNNAQLSQWTQAGLNGLRVHPGSQPVVWGARTLDGQDTANSEWRYLSVRRLALHIERSVLGGTAWSVDEPNGDRLWARLRATVEGFLLGLFQQGAFQGQRVKEACFVQCNRDTTTNADIAAGQTNLLIGFAALKPSEFVLLRLRLPARPAD